MLTRSVTKLYCDSTLNNTMKHGMSGGVSLYGIDKLFESVDSLLCVLKKEYNFPETEYVVMSDEEKRDYKKVIEAYSSLPKQRGKVYLGGMRIN